VSIEAAWDARRRLRTSVIAGLAGFLVLAVAGLLVGALRPATYRSTAVLGLEDPTVTSASNPGSIEKISRLRELYGPLLTTDPVVEPVAEETGLTKSQVANRVSAVVAKDSLLLLVSATGSSRSQSQRLASAAADELVRYSADVQRVAGVPANRAVRLDVLSPAAGAVKVTARTRTVLTVSGLLGLLGTVAGIVVTGRRTDG
jgi:capsular polysaccharide biosynthesis protein